MVNPLEALIPGYGWAGVGITSIANGIGDAYKNVTSSLKNSLKDEILEKIPEGDLCKSWNGEEIKYSSTSRKPNKLVPEVINAIGKTGIDVKACNPYSNIPNLAFDKAVKDFQKKVGLTPTGTIDKLTLLCLDNVVDSTDPLKMQEKADTVSNYSKTGVPQEGIAAEDYYQNIENSEDENDNALYDPHYEPYFLNTSSKDARRNRKDIVIVMGENGNVKRIKDVYMRSVSVEVDTSGKPVTEVYQFIARDVKESDASEDNNIYLDEIPEVSSDIKYNYDSLFKDR